MFLQNFFFHSPLVCSISGGSIPQEIYIFFSRKVTDLNILFAFILIIHTHTHTHTQSLYSIALGDWGLCFVANMQVEDRQTDQLDKGSDG